MVKKYLFLLAMLCGSISMSFAQSFVYTNQVGYSSSSSKMAMIASLSNSRFVVKDAATDNDVYSGTISDAKYWRDSNDEIRWADFSSFQTPGKYYIKVGNDRTPSFEITKGGEIYDELLLWTLKSYYLWRCSSEIKEEYSTFRGTSYARPAGHPDTTVYLHNTLATPSRHADTELKCPGGWYDAGDYGKYTVNAGITLHQLLTAYEMEMKAFDTLNLNLPESNNGIADLADEILYELRWLKTMQDPDDGGVYNKVTTLRFPGMIMPHDDKADRYVIGKTTAAAYDFAAVMAKAARVLKGKIRDESFLKDALAKAKKAFDYAVNRKESVFDNPDDCNTGEYSYADDTDERLWAATELLLTTGDKKYVQYIDFFQIFTVPFWGDTKTLGLISLALCADKLPEGIDKLTVERKFRAIADSQASMFGYSPGKVPVKEFFWGSNGQVANSGAILAIAYRLYGQDKHLKAAQYCLDYLLGANATGYCFVTGFGRVSPMHIHDRRSEADGITNPLPGYLVGGPNLNQTTDCGRSAYPSGKFPARAYLDDVCSYSTNEIAINWNSPLVLMTSILRNVYMEKSKNITIKENKVHEEEDDFEFDNR